MMTPIVPWHHQLGAVLAKVLHAPTIPFAFTLMLVIALQLGHVLSPIMLAWGHPGYRRIAVARPLKYVAIPGATVVATTVIGWLAGRELLRYTVNEGSLLAIWRDRQLVHPFIALFVLYLGWNVYHFAKQNMGVLQIYRIKSGLAYPAFQRRVDEIFSFTIMFIVLALSVGLFQIWDGTQGWWTLAMPTRLGWAAVALTLAASAVMLWREGNLPRRLFIINLALAPLLMVFWPVIVLRTNSAIWLLHLGNYRLPAISFWPLAVVFVNHWMVAIGLSSHVYARARDCTLVLPTFIVIISGIVVYCALFVSPQSGLITATTTAIGFRRGLDLTHFLYDRYLYQFSKPEIRNTIGKDLFAPRPDRLQPFPVLAE